MRELRYIWTSMIYRLVLLLAGAMYRSSWFWWSRPGLRDDASQPVASCPPEYRGPTAKQVIEWYSRKGGEWVSPPDAIE
jgi:hypothetical protein